MSFKTIFLSLVFIFSAHSKAADFIDFNPTTQNILIHTLFTHMAEVEKNKKSTLLDFKYCLNLYEFIHGTLNKFPIENYSDRFPFVELALDKGVKPNKYILKKAIESNDSKLGTLLFSKK